MALKQCVFCGKDYSDTIVKCPHCEYKSVFVCPECNSFYTLDETNCKNCGIELVNLTRKELNKEEIIKIIDEVALVDINQLSIEEINKIKNGLVIFEKFEKACDIIQKCDDAISRIEEHEMKKSKFLHLCDSIECSDNSRSVENLLVELKSYSDEFDVVDIELTAKKRLQELRYSECEKSMKNNKRISDWENTKKQLSLLEDYKDSQEKKRVCEERISQIKRKNKKKIILICSLIATSIIAICAYIALKPMVLYNKGNEAYEIGDYQQAIEYYTSAGDYKDSQDKVIMSNKANNYSIGLVRMDAKNYTGAITAFKESNGFNDANTKIYECGIELFNQQKYKDALTAFNGLSVKDSYNRAIYCDAMVHFNDTDFDVAKQKFSSITDFLDASYYVNASDLMIAEKYIDKGYLMTARDIYSTLPTDFVYNDVSVKDRMGVFNKYKDVVNLCGEWIGTGEGKAHVYQIYKRTGSWDAWTTTYSNPTNTDFTIYGRINDDNTISLYGNATYMLQTDYSVLSEYLKEKKNIINFDIKMTKKFNETKIADYVKVTATSNTITLVHNHLDKSVSINFNYRYKSNWKYKKTTNY